MSYEEDVILPDDDSMEFTEDEDIILPDDDTDQLISQQEEYDKEIEEANAEVYSRAYAELLEKGYTPEQAEAYHRHPEVIQNTVDKMKEEAFLAFREKYPNVKPEEISKETWKAFERTGDLIYSFENYDAAFEGLNEGLPKAKRTSRRSKQDPFLAGFEEE